MSLYFCETYSTLPSFTLSTLDMMREAADTMGDVIGKAMKKMQVL